MKRCSEIEKLFVDYLFGEIDTKNRKAVDLHLKECSRCALEMKELKGTLSIMEQRERAKPPDEYWDTYWYRLEDRMKNAKAKRPVLKAVIWQRLQKVLSTVPRPAYQWATVAAVLVIGILIGRFFLVPGGIQEVPLAGNRIQTGDGVFATAVDDRAQRYIERSKIFLLGFVNTNGEIDASGYDMGRQREISQGLIQEAGFLKDNLDDRSQQKMRALIEELETILIEIANLEEQEDYPDIELIREGIDRKGILLKINVHQMIDEHEQETLDDMKSKRDII